MSQLKKKKWIHWWCQRLPIFKINIVILKDDFMLSMEKKSKCNNTALKANETRTGNSLNEEKEKWNLIGLFTKSLLCGDYTKQPRKKYFCLFPWAALWSLSVYLEG